jgi:hypothetical protein
MRAILSVGTAGYRAPHELQTSRTYGPPGRQQYNCQLTYGGNLHRQDDLCLYPTTTSRAVSTMIFDSPVIVQLNGVSEYSAEEVRLAL